MPDNRERSFEIMDNRFLRGAPTGAAADDEARSSAPAGTKILKISSLLRRAWLVVPTTRSRRSRKPFGSPFAFYLSTAAGTDRWRNGFAI
jgi:hypothetical protein